MQTYPSPQQNARPFATAPYCLGTSEVPTPLGQPWSCPEASGESADCAIRVHHWRELKTGPGFPLLVLHCRALGKTNVCCDYAYGYYREFGPSIFLQPLKAAKSPSALR